MAVVFTRWPALGVAMVWAALRDGEGAMVRLDDPSTGKVASWAITVVLAGSTPRPLGYALACWPAVMVAFSSGCLRWILNEGFADCAPPGAPAA